MKKDTTHKMSRTLLAACGKGDLISVKYHLKKNKSKINTKGASGFFPLGGAANGGHQDVVKLLLKHGARINMRTRWNWTPLYIAADRGHNEVAEILIKNEALLNTQTQPDYNSPNGYAPIHIACERNHIKIVKYLVKAGAKINLKNGDNETPLDMAINKRRYKLACYLALNGGKPATQKNFI